MTRIVIKEMQERQRERENQRDEEMNLNVEAPFPEHVLVFPTQTTKSGSIRQQICKYIHVTNARN